MSGKTDAQDQQQKTASNQPSAINVDLLEQDDEFEEFPQEDWAADKEDKEDQQLWEDNWDDDTVEDDFSKQLRAELESRQPQSMAQ